MSEGSTFPIFIRPELQDGSPAFAEFKRLASSASKEAAASFKADFREVTSVISNALSKGLNGGKLDFDLSQLKQAQAEARLFGEALNGTLRTAQLLAAETGDTTAETRQYILALETASKAQDENRRGIDAQIATYTRLQTAMDVTADKNSKLAQAYRETFAEAARMARIEVDNRSLGATIAPAISSRATDNGAGYSALAALQEKIIKQEELYGQIAKRNQQEVAAAVQFNKRAAEEYAGALAQLRQQIDPVAAAQEAVNRELEFAALAYKRGDISAEQFTTRQKQLNAALKQAEGTFRDTRQGMVMVGQQVQDLGISLLSGQRASTVLAQQIPQLTFAFTSFGGKVGAVATALSSGFLPSIALVAGSFGLGLLIDKFLETDDATAKTGKTIETFAEQLNREKHSLDEVIAANREYIRSQERARESTFQSIQASVISAKTNLADALAIREKIKAQLEAAIASDTANRGQGSVPGVVSSVTGGRVDDLRAQLREQEEKIGKLSTDALGAVGNVAEEIAKINTDPRYQLDVGFSKLREDAHRLYNGDLPKLQKRLEEINRQERAAREALNQSNRGGQSTNSRDARVGDMTALLRELFPGVRITSTTGGRHAKNSDHYAGRAIDFVVPGKMNAAGTDEVRRILEDAGVSIRRNSAGREQFFGPGRDAKTRGDHSDHFHVAWKGSPSPEGAEKAAERAARAQEVLNQAIAESATSVSRLRGQFDEAPRDIDLATAAVADLNKVIEEADPKLKARGLTDAQKKVIQQTRDNAIQTRDEVIPAFLKRPINDRIRDGDRELQLQRLVLAGREDEADILAFQFDVMRQMNVTTEGQLRTELESRGISWEKYQILIKQREELITMQRAQDRLDRAVKSSGSKLRELDRAYETIVQGVADLPKKGIDGIKDIVNSIRRQANEIIARRIVDRIAGNLFQRLEDQIRGKKPIDAATDNYVRSTKEANAALIDLTNGFRQAAAAFRGAANDNSPLSLGKTAGANSWLDEIIVRAKSGKEDGITSELKKLNKTTASGLGKEAPFLKGLSKQVGIALEGAFVGQTASSFARSLGIKQSSTGAAIGGGLGGLIGKATGIPGLDIVGGLLGGTLGGLFKKTPRGYATIGAGSDGGLAIIGSGGNSKSAQKAGMGAAGATLDALAQIADALGGTYDASKGSVSIGRSGDSWHVDTTGRGRLKKSQGGIDFDDDYEAAVRYATMDLIKDGVISGLKASTQRLLQNAKDLDAGLQKALDFESVFTRLKEYKDPVGAALDGLDKEFTRLKSIFKEAGASAEEYAQLEELYGLERAKAIEEAAKKVTASLKSLYDDLTLGDNGRSLRDRLSAAQAAYDPLKARVLAGDQSAYDAFAEAAKQLLDVQRQFSGSQTPYFTLLNEITKITKDRIDAESNIVSIAQGRDSPFTSTGAKNDNYKPVTAAIEQQTSDLLNGIAKIVASGGGGGALGGGFTPRFL